LFNVLTPWFSYFRAKADKIYRQKNIYEKTGCYSALNQQKGENDHTVTSNHPIQQKGVCHEDSRQKHYSTGLCHKCEASQTNRRKGSEE